MLSAKLDFNADVTHSWWDRLLNDKETMERWLCKLWRTEFNGIADNIEATQKYAIAGSLEDRIFRKTGADEERHALVLWDLLRERGITPVREEQPESIYWKHVNGIIADIHSCAAVFAVGEELAARRFAVIQADKRTPSDIKYFLDVATKDEEYHAKAFENIASEPAMVAAIKRHYEAIDMMLGVRPS